MSEFVNPQVTNARTRAKRAYEALHPAEAELPRERRFKQLPGIPSNGIPSTMAEIQRLAAIAAPSALDQLNWLARHAKAENVRVAAANSILDRAFGKPNQPLDVSLDGVGSISLEDREKLLDMLAMLAPPIAASLTIDAKPIEAELEQPSKGKRK